MLEREFQKKRQIRSRIYSKTTVVILLIALVIFARATWNMYQTELQSQKDFDRVSGQLTALRAREDDLNSEIARLNTEKGTEEEIRKKFNVAKPGEGVVYVVESPQTAVVTAPNTGFFGKILNWFVNIF